MGSFTIKTYDSAPANGDHAADGQGKVEGVGAIQQPAGEDGRKGGEDKAAEVLDGPDRGDNPCRARWTAPGPSRRFPRSK